MESTVRSKKTKERERFLGFLIDSGVGVFHAAACYKYTNIFMNIKKKLKTCTNGKNNNCIVYQLVEKGKI